jgi:hypothetical protein
MCDYSLLNRASRPAKVGEKLTTNTFVGSVTRGFTAPDDAKTAVCVLPGTEISFDENVRTSSTFPFDAVVNGSKRVIGVPPKSVDNVATFIQVDKDCPTKHHDALEFADGNIVLLTHLEPGQMATVLAMPADPKTLAERKEQERAVFA